MRKLFNKTDLLVLIIGIVAVCFGFFYLQFGVHGTHESKPIQQPIIFVSDQNRANSAARHLLTTTSRSGASVAMHIDVYGDQPINYTANQNVKAKQPIIEINFGDRTNTTKKQSKKLNIIFKHLNKKYGYKIYDVIGFGSGNLAIFDNAVTYGQNKNNMLLSHFVSIAGPYQGIMPPRMPDGRPVNRELRNNNGTNVDYAQRNRPNNHVVNGKQQDIARQQRRINLEHHLIDLQQRENKRLVSYKELKAKSKNLDKATSVLNIYGVISSGDRSDGRVSETSAQSLKNLVRKDNYQSLKLTGPTAEHGNILDNQIAERLINRFLFNE